MSGRLQAELRQSKPFSSLEQETHLNLVRTCEHLEQGIEETLKPSGLSPSQYNVLRILRGAGEQGLACGEVAERMVTRDPDVTRLLDRLEQRGFISRTRENRDRRVITVRVTGEGLNLLRDLEQPMADIHRRQLGHLGEKKLEMLIQLLEEARAD